MRLLLLSSLTASTQVSAWSGQGVGFWMLNFPPNRFQCHFSNNRALEIFFSAYCARSGQRWRGPGSHSQACGRWCSRARSALSLHPQDALWWPRTVVHTQARMWFLPFRTSVRNPTCLEGSRNRLLGFLPRGGSIAPKCAASMRGVWPGVQVCF